MVMDSGGTIRVREGNCLSSPVNCHRRLGFQPEEGARSRCNFLGVFWAFWGAIGLGAHSVSCLACLASQVPAEVSGLYACTRLRGAVCPGASRLRGAVFGRVAADARWAGCARLYTQTRARKYAHKYIHANARSGRDSCGNVHASRAAAVTAVTTHGCRLHMSGTHLYFVSRHAHAFSRQLGMPGKPAISQPGGKPPNGECSLPWLSLIHI